MAADRLDDARLDHLVIEVVALAGALADAGEHREAAVALAMLLISSMMSTVLPTPAPPNRPILPPLAYGASRSMTLMPVTRISRLGRLVDELGALAVDRRLGRADRAALVDRLADDVEDAAERLRADRHRDRRAGVGDFFWPRTRPSVESMAMVRTVFSPRCCATSRCRRKIEHDLLFDRQRRELRLLQQLGQARAAVAAGAASKASRSEPNCAKAAISRYCASSSLIVPAPASSP
jgi:hypothetical protein